MKLGLHNTARYCYYPGWQQPGTTTEYESALEAGWLTVTLDVQVPADLASDTLLRAVEGQAGGAHIRISPHG